MRTSESIDVHKKNNYIHKEESAHVINSLLKDLGSKSGLEREAARNKLVKMDGPVIDYLSGLLSRPENIVRWEAIKALSDIANPVSIPMLIKALYDDDEEVRWIAAEGLIAIGKAAIKPVLEELLKNSKSFRLKRGVHHLLTGLSAIDKSLDFSELIGTLNDYATKTHILTVTYKALKKARKMKIEKKPAKARPRLH